MRIEATAKQIRALLELARLNEGADELTPEAYRRGRDAAQRGLPRPLLDRYHWLLKAGRSPAVAAIVRGACSGCHVRLPTMVEYKARHSLALHTCPHCRRMLYAPELIGDGSGAEDATPGSRGAKPASSGRRS